jgi:hypothetical protein
VFGSFAKVDDREEKLSEVLVDACTAADDLLELGHRLDVLVERDDFACLRVDTGRQKFRGCNNDRVLRFGVNEVIELGLAFVVVARDPHHILAVLRAKVAIFVDESLAHSLGMIDVLAKDDRLVESIGPFQKLRDLARHQGCSLLQDERAIEVALVVDAVLDFLAMLVALSSFRTPTGEVPIEIDAHDLVRGEKAILDPLPQ